MTKIHATLAEKLAVNLILAERLHPIEGSDLFRYEEGWTDYRIAQEVHPRLGSNNVRGVRLEMFGPLQRTFSPTTPNALEARVTLLENQLRRILDVHRKLGLNAEDREYILGPIGHGEAATLDDL